MDEYRPFGERLRRYRKAQDLTQQELARLAGCAASTIVKFENETRRPSRQMAEHLANTLKIPISERQGFLESARGLRERQTTTATLPTVQLETPELPEPATPLIGRIGEVAAIKQLLHRPECRLLTIVGPGGIGKTRIALQAAAELRQDYANGTAFASLASLSSAELLPVAIAAATGLHFHSTGEPRTQLLNTLRRTRLLLVLDSIEHLLEDGLAIDLINSILSQAPGVSMLVTSRERLNLQQEWMFEVQGLAVPPASTASLPAEHLLEDYPSVALLLQRARRLRPRFFPTLEDWRAMARICRAVDGFPLGIELAAAWFPALSFEEIAQEIEQGIDFLNVSARDVPERHRSIQAVFDYSWKLLCADEQRVLAHLAVFQGSFTRQAAQQVAGASLNSLSSLVAKSLLRRTADGRYDLHDLVRYYAGKQLHSAGEQTAARRLYAFFYLDLLHACLPRLQSSEQSRVLSELDAEIDNLRCAWNFAIELGLILQMTQAAWALWYFFDLRNLYSEYAAMFLRAEEAVAALSSDNHPSQRQLTAAVCAFRTWRAFTGVRSAPIGEMRPLVQGAIQQLRSGEQATILGDALWVYGLLSWLSGDFDAAAQTLLESLELNRLLQRRWQVGFATVLLGAVRHEQGAYAEAYELLNQGLKLCQAQGVLRNTTFALGLLTRTAQVLGQQQDLQTLLHEHLHLARAINDLSAVAFILEHLALQSSDDPPAARQYFQQAIDHYTALGDLWSAARTLNAAGRLELALSQDSQARLYFGRALQAALNAQSHPGALDALGALAELLARQEDHPASLRLIHYVQAHSASSKSAVDRLEPLRTRLESCLDPQVRENAKAWAQSTSLEAAAEFALEV